MQDHTSHGQNPPAPPLSRASLYARHRLTIVALALAGVLGLAWTIKRSFANPRVESIGYTELVAHAAAGDVMKAEIDGERVTLKLKDGRSALGVVANAHSQHAVVSAFAERNVPVEF